jgi:hypothetical protein
MRRALEIEIEACDALLGLLRVHAAAEVHRWPSHLSGGLALAVDDEMERLEPIVRELGVSYQCLEDHAVATIDRTPQSRFSDVDGAFHLVACPITIDIDLDPLRIALDRGDRPTRDGAIEVANALRTVVASLARSELLVYHKLLLAGAEQSADRVLRFVDAFLAEAWTAAPAPEPALPSMLPVAIGYEPHPSLAEIPAAGLRAAESTEVFRLDLDPSSLEDA